MPLKRHGAVSFLFHYFLSSVYVILKWTFTPVVLVITKLFRSSKTANMVDEFLNRLFLPLTEKPGREWRRDVAPDLGKDDFFMDHILRDKERNPLKIRNLIEDHWATIVLVRGAWCSYSRMHMSDLQDHYPEFKDAGIQLIAISSRVQVLWWHRDGIRIGFYEDGEGSLFHNLGIRHHSWTDEAWGRIVPLEGVLLFNPDGKLFDFDLRRVSGTKTGQEFLSARQILKRFSEERSGHE